MTNHRDIGSASGAANRDPNDLHDDILGLGNACPTELAGHTCSLCENRKPLNDTSHNTPKLSDTLPNVPPSFNFLVSLPSTNGNEIATHSSKVTQNGHSLTLKERLKIEDDLTHWFENSSDLTKLEMLETLLFQASTKTIVGMHSTLEAEGRC